MIDWIVAERIAQAVAGRGDARRPRADLASMCRDAEARVCAYTGLTPARPLPAPEGIERAEWIAANVSSMRRLLDPVLAKAGSRMGPLKPLMQISTGLAVSGEVGVILGYMGQRVLGQYELVLLDEAVADSEPRLLFVLPNLGKAVENFDAEPDEFVTWVALHEVTHAVQFSSVDWLHGHVAGLAAKLLASAELRVDAPSRLRIPRREDVTRIIGALKSGDLISIVASEAERETFDQMQSVMAVIEGHAEHVMDAVAPDLLPNLDKLRGALDKRRKTQTTLGRIIARLLGLEMKMRQYEQGKRFCDAVVAIAGVEGLHRVFSSPAALPSAAELDDPAAWVDRVLPRDLPAAAGA